MISVLLFRVVFLVVLFYRLESRKRTMRHTELLRSLEVGQKLPDAEIARAMAIGVIGTLVPVCALGAAVGSTALVPYVLESNEVALLCTIWGVCGVIAMLSVVIGLAMLGGGDGDEADEEKSAETDGPEG